jgi:hypothetical protein
MAPAGSDFELLQYRRVMDVGCRVTFDRLTLLESDEVRLGPDGFILEKDALAIEADVNNALHNALIVQGSASNARFVLSRTDDILATKRVNGETRILPLGYIKEIVHTIGFDNPNVAAG